VSGGDLPRYGVFVYSDLCIEPQSGDVAGNRVSLLRYSDVDKLIFEYTEGALMAPLFADKMAIDYTAGALAFEVREDSQTVTFRGTVTDDASSAQSAIGRSQSGFHGSGISAGNKPSAGDLIE
jgi:hypothetical protein